MTEAQLAEALARDYRAGSPYGRVVQIHLFAIRHAAALDGVSLSRVLALAGLPESYRTELRKGMNLSHYVRLHEG